MRNRETVGEREKHLNEEHPYERFPVERIEEAVRSISMSTIRGREVDLFRFGHEVAFQRIWSKSGERRSLPRPFVPINRDLPEPPSERFQRFRGPIPIMR